MKKAALIKTLFLSVLFVFIFLVFSSNTYAQSSNCWNELNDKNSVCGQGITKCNACIGENVSPSCSQECNKAMDKCSQAGNALQACLGVDKNPLKLQPVKPGHLSCEEWKPLLIVGTAENCTVPGWTQNGLKCLSSVTEITQEMNHPIDYIFDFNIDSCKPTEDDLTQLKAGLPLISEENPGVSGNQTSSIGQKSQSNPISKFVRDVGNYFKPSGINAGKNVKPDFSIDNPPLKDLKTPNLAQAINNWIKDTFGESAPVVSVSDPQILNRTPKLSDQTVNEIKQKFDPQKSPYQVPVLEGEVMVKLPGSNDWTSLKEGDRIAPGSSIFTGMDSKMLLLIRDKGIIEVLPFTEITVSEQGLEQADKEGKTSMDVKLRTGEIEVNVEGGIYTGGFQVQMINGVAGVRGTHFWVSYDSNKAVSTVGVYRGIVDVKNNFGNGKLISPDGKNTEAVKINNQLSISKTGIIGLLVAGVIGGGAFVLNRRSKRKRH